MKKSLLLLVTIILFRLTNVFACSPCSALSNVTQNLNGTNLELTFTSNAGWQCCYTVNIEIVCASSNFTGVANHLSQQICINGGGASSSTWSTPEPYPLTAIDVSGFCPGTYKWRAWEVPCGIYTQEFQFTITGSSPMVVDATASETLICEGENSQLTASASNGCNGPYSYSWSPATGLSNANIANPVATPSSTTIYTVTVTEPGSCATTNTQSLTINVNPLPTATVSSDVSVCQGDPSPTVTFTGATGTAPYTINYTLNGTPQPPITTNGNTFSISPVTNVPGTYDVQLVDVTDASSTQCSQAQNGSMTMTVFALPVVNAGTDVQICEANPVTPSDVTLSGSGASTYTWDNGISDGVSFVPPTGVTTYTVTGTDANGCVDTDQVVVTAYPLPIAAFSGSPDFGNAPLAVTFTNTSQNANNFDWDFDNGNTATTTTTTAAVSQSFGSAGLYTVLLTASNGICWDTATYIIEVIPPMVVTPPNIFTPNGDGANDEYFVNVIYGEKFEGEIFNRWGNSIGTLNSINQGWDGKSKGKDVDDGVYYIIYKATDFNDQSVEGHTYFHLVR